MNASTDQSAFVSAFAVGADARELVNVCVRDLGELSSALNFGFVYASDALANQLPRLMSLLADATQVQQWCGTLATGVCSDNLELYDQAGIAILLCNFNADAWHTFACNPEKPELAQLDKSFVPSFGIMHADPNNPETPAMIATIQSSAASAPLHGALTLSQTQPLQIAGNRIYDGASGVFFDHSVPVLTEVTQACTPIGSYHEVTAISDNRVVSLDGEPALRLLYKEAGEFLSNDLIRLREYVFAGLQSAPGTTTDASYLVRDLLAFDENKNTVTVNANIKIGDKLLFCSRDGNKASTDLDKMLERVEKKLNGAKPRGAIYHCSGNRGKYLFGSNSRELKRIQSSLGYIPLAGSFTAGEIHHGRTHSHSGVLTIFL